MSAPRIWHASLFTKPRCRYQPSRANSKIGNWHASPPLRRETAAATSGWPDYRLHDIHGPFGYWSELVFPPSCSKRPKRAPLQGTSRCEPPPKERVGIFDRVVKYRNKLPASVVTAHSVTDFKKRLEKAWTEEFYTTPPPNPPAHHPLTVIIFICYPAPCSIKYVVSSTQTTSLVCKGPA